MPDNCPCDEAGLVQRKTGMKLWIPMTQPLQAAVATWQRRPAPILEKMEEGVG